MKNNNFIMVFIDKNGFNEPSAENKGFTKQAVSVKYNY